MQLILIWLLQHYQLYISPYVGNRCRFYPSCSSYAIDAIRKYGCFKSFYFIARRLARCHPFHQGGFDPVP